MVEELAARAVPTVSRSGGRGRVALKMTGDVRTPTVRRPGRRSEDAGDVRAPTIRRPRRRRVRGDAASPRARMTPARRSKPRHAWPGVRNAKWSRTTHGCSRPSKTRFSSSMRSTCFWSTSLARLTSLSAYLVDLISAARARSLRSFATRRGGVAEASRRRCHGGVVAAASSQRRRRGGIAAAWRRGGVVAAASPRGRQRRGGSVVAASSPRRRELDRWCRPPEE